MKKITLGVLVFAVIALLGVGMVFASPFKFGKGVMFEELTEEERTQMQDFHEALTTAIENEDFESWKSLMESQITEENFNKMIEMREKEEERKAEMEENREKFCDENGCPDFKDKEFLGDSEGCPRMHMGFDAPVEE